MLILDPGSKKPGGPDLNFPIITENLGKTIKPPHFGPERAPSGHHLRFVGSAQQKRPPWFPDSPPSPPGTGGRIEPTPPSFHFHPCLQGRTAQAWGMIEIRHIDKSFAAKRVLKGISFNARRGEIVGLVGRNGAGKSTLMRVIAGCLQPDGGSIERGGVDKIGYLPEGAPLYDELTPRAGLEFVLGAHGFGRARQRQRATEVMHLLELDSVADQVVQTLSKGFSRRAALGMALAPDPDLLILDEPFDGFDPIQKHAAANLLVTLSPQKIIIISTHSLSDAQRLCTRLIVIEEGKVCADASPEDLLKKTGGVTLDAAFRALVAGS